MNIVNGTHYHEKTPQDVIDVLEEARDREWRIRVHYGNTLIGQDWNEHLDVLGRVGRSMGPVKIPILLYDRRSICGAPMLDHCIVRIRFSNQEKAKGRDLYRHSNYHGEAA